MVAKFELINGIKFGIEHVDLRDDEESDMDYIIAIDFFCFRLAIVKFSD